MDKSEIQVLDRIKNSIRGIEPTAEIFLFGSRARGDEREN